MAHVTNWTKFCLLLWKNWQIQWAHPLQLFFQVFSPVLFCLILVFLRYIAKVQQHGTLTYTPMNMTLELFAKFMRTQPTFAFPERGIAYSPNTSIAYREIMKDAVFIMANIVQNLSQVPNPWEETVLEGYPDRSTLHKALMHKRYFAGVEFDEDMNKYPKTFAYALRFPVELRTAKITDPMKWATWRLFPLTQRKGPRNSKDNDGGIPVGYMREGFLPLQHSVAMAFLKRESGIEDFPLIQMQRYPYLPFTVDPLHRNLRSFMPYIMMLAFIYFAICTVHTITTEREKQLKEVMKIVGLPNWIHWLAWFVKCFTILAVSGVLVALVLKIKWFRNLAVLANIDITVLLVFIYFYSVLIICFCFLMSSCFSKASTAAAVTAVLWFATFVPYTFIMQNYDHYNFFQMLLASFALNTWLGFGLKIIIDYESTGPGLQWPYILTPLTVDDDLTMGHLLMILPLAAILYILVCLYLEQIFPGEFGVARKWNFPLSTSFWCGREEIVMTSAGISEIRNRNSAFETEPKNLKAGVTVKELRKVYGDREVVKGVSMNMYQDQITVLLGHNGAGKTTTISMLTGVFPPTSGSAIVNGKDIRTDMEGARRSLGLCPQRNVLFDDLSVANHIIFFSYLKGLDQYETDYEVAKYLTLIELQDKADVCSSKLSGGMQRKLALCCALCGDTKVVLCDEPTSGMDPAARRQVWDLLQQEKAGRTILLTTHYMDEADVLGDRIGIMANGQLMCLGTPFYLKKQFGTGYQLICVKRSSCHSPHVTALLNRFIPGLEPATELGAELIYQLQDSQTAIFSEMFAALEDASDSLRLSGYGIGITTMGEVFMKVGAEKTASMDGHEYNATTESSIFPDMVQVYSGLEFCLNQWRAMLRKNLLISMRNKLLLLVQILVPLYFLLVSILIWHSYGILREPVPMTMSLLQYPRAVVVSEAADSLNSTTIEYRILTEYQKLVQSYGKAYTHKLINSSFSAYMLNKDLYDKFDEYVQHLAAATFKEQNILTWLNNKPLHTAPLTVNLVHNAMARVFIDPKARIIITNKPLPYTRDTMLQQAVMGITLGQQLSFNLCFGMCFMCALYAIALIKERVSRAKLLQFVSGVRVWTFWLTKILSDLVTYLLAILVLVLVLFGFQEDGYSNFNELGRMFLVLLIFGISVLPYIYLLSLVFKEPAAGFACISVLNLFIGVVPFFTVVILREEELKSAHLADVIESCALPSPLFTFALSLSYLDMNSALQSACNMDEFSELEPEERCNFEPRCCDITPYFAWKHPGILRELVFMLGTGFICFVLLLLYDYRILERCANCVKQCAGSPIVHENPSSKEDDDVKEEKLRVLDMSPEELSGQNLVVDRAVKWYGSFLAVNEISLCVNSHECFGLLGINGAGKTTTFKMLTGDVQISDGRAYVKGINVSTNLTDVYTEIGYCPQFDAVFDELTGRENLKIFCLLRGIERQRITYISEHLARLFGFMRHIDKQSRFYSGGNKRKLSAAIAVIGSPTVVFLDEPTAGMDPVARRHLWNVVCRIRDTGKSIVLTSHSMEECEALCTRLAIMVNGEFKCIGSTQHLKNKFSKGLIMRFKIFWEVKNTVRQPTLIFQDSRTSTIARHRKTQMSSFVPPLRLRHHTIERSTTIRSSVDTANLQRDVERVKHFVSEEFPQAVLKEEYLSMLMYYIPLTQIKWSRVFGVIEEHRHELNIEDYSISQTTLEEIFLDFAQKQAMP